MGWVGLEPTTNALKGRCSTIELPTLGKRSGTVSLKSSVASPFRIAAKTCRAAGLVKAEGTKSAKKKTKKSKQKEQRAELQPNRR
jgi:hypothetical protein